MIASTTPGTHNPRISAQTVTNRLLEISERPPYTMYVLFAEFHFWPSIWLLVGFHPATGEYKVRSVQSTPADNT